MGTPTLTIRLDALAQNWQALDRRSGASCQTAAVVKADGYGLGVAEVGPALAKAGARTFFVAVAEEGVALRKALGSGPEIGVFSGHMATDTGLLRDHALIPMLNSPEQVARHRAKLPDAPFGIQLDSGMRRLGIAPDDFAALRESVLAAKPWLVMSHLACADEPQHPQNAAQLATFTEMTNGLGLRRSLSATGGILLGSDYHFDMTRPGIGLYGGAPFSTALQVAELSIPVIQCRNAAPGDSVGYGASWVAARPSRIATLAAGYADGLIRAMSNTAVLHARGVPCPLAGRVSMDLLTVDVTDYVEAHGADPDALDILGPYQGVDVLADAAGTIGYEILTSLGGRYARRYRTGAPA
ncbi:alanine racemase [Meridianimarinicoccus aquatilis]|uniref:Alanine racemase n=1 Tax=Meridianimarinicoccus aquatilis TaxID=2552766 RepID=A0A4R6B2G4_9RHOB|nr:alanine racemase [Fluviibacterium aquatile]TDL91361.1 alanine racemase [Fluviibacterium aquatile]